jgi:predicted RNase H-like HicB family nuclease
VSGYELKIYVKDGQFHAYLFDTEGIGECIAFTRAETIQELFDEINYWPVSYG